MAKQSIITILLTALMSMTGVKAFAYDIEVANTNSVTIYYDWANNQTELTVCYCASSNYTGNVVIPESVEYDGNAYPVTSIGSYAFYDSSGLTSITIPNSVTSIGELAFGDCSGLTSIKVESGNTRYDSRDNCNAIIETSSNTLIAGCKNTIIPNNVTSIGNSAFSGSSALTSVTIPNSVTSIGWAAFQGCSGLTSVTIGNSVESIGGFAFLDCSSLTSVTIPNSVTSIGQSSFSGCSGLTSVTIGNSVSSIGGSAFRDCRGLTSVTIPNNVTSIGDYAFSHCWGLTSVTIPNSVTSIGCDAFSSTAWLNNQPNGLVYTGKVAYRYKGTMPANCHISLKDGTLGIAGSAFSNCRGLTSVTIPNSVTSIGLSVFSNCSDLTSIKVESGNTKYDSRDNCNAIIETSSNTLISGCNNTTIPKSVTSIGDKSFSYCRDLTSITIPNSVESIGSFAFCGCSGLTSVIIPNSVTSIGDKAFSGCSGLTSVTIPKRVTSIGEAIFEYCSGLTSVTIPSSVTSIGSYAFSQCSGLTSVTIPSSVTSIGNYAFYNCSGLTTIVSKIENLFEIGDGVFLSYPNDIYATVILFVPAMKKSAYEVTEGWKGFTNIKEIVDGDVNLDEKVNKDDQGALVAHIMGEKPKGFFEGLADLNGDDDVNAADVVKLVDILNNGGLSTETEFGYDNVDGSLVVSSLTCTLNNERDEAILLTRCELYSNGSLLRSKSYSSNPVSVAADGNKSCTFDNLSKPANSTDFTVCWHYTVNDESFVYRCPLID